MAHSSLKAVLHYMLRGASQKEKYGLAPTLWGTINEMEVWVKKDIRRHWVSVSKRTHMSEDLHDLEVYVFHSEDQAKECQSYILHFLMLLSLQ